MDYTVQEGETLSEILYNLTGDGTAENYNQVAEDNNISDPDHINAGQVIHIDESKISPGANTGTDASTAQTPTSNNGSGAGANNSNNASENKTQPNNGTTSQVTDNNSKKTDSNSSTNGNEASKDSKNDSQNNQTTASGSNSSQATSTATVATQTASSSASSSSGNYRFTSSIEDDDDIVMDVQEARNYINGTMDADLGQMCRSLTTLVSDLETMQGRQYSTTGTAVDEDYKDFESLTEALGDFLVECNKVLEDITNYIDSVERTLMT